MILAAVLVKLAWIGAGAAVVIGLIVYAVNSSQQALGE